MANLRDPDLDCDDPDATCEKKKRCSSNGRNSYTLSWCAETADGYRDEELQLILHPTKGLRIQRLTEDMDKEDRELCRVNTKSCVPARTKVVQVTLTLEDGSTLTTKSGEGDCIFWTESAVDKFLYPYYHAQRIWDATMDGVKKAYESNPNVVAVRHRAPSNSQVLGVAASNMVEIAVARPGSKTPQWMAANEFVELSRLIKQR